MAKQLVRDNIEEWVEKLQNIAYTIHYVHNTFDTCVYCGADAAWCSENDSSKTLCNWCINNMLILGGKNYVNYTPAFGTTQKRIVNFNEDNTASEDLKKQLQNLYANKNDSSSINPYNFKKKFN